MRYRRSNYNKYKDRPDKVEDITFLDFCNGTVTEYGYYCIVATRTREPSQWFAYRLGAVYIDVSFLPLSSAPHLDIRVHRHSNCTGLHACYAMLVPRLSRRDIYRGRVYR